MGSIEKVSLAVRMDNGCLKLKCISINHRHKCIDAESHVLIISHNSGDAGEPPLSILILMHVEFL
jgi:hypothetical protein